MNIQLSINEYLEWKKSYSLSAWKAYRGCLEKFAKMYPNWELGDITNINVTRFIQLQKITLSSCTVLYYTNILKDFFGYFRTQVNPKTIRGPKFTPRPRQYVTQEEFLKLDSLLDEWEYYQLQKKVALHLLWFTGMRVSELCDLDTLQIENSKNQAKIVTKKNKKERWIMWSGTAHKLLMRYLGTRICLNQRPELFTTSKGRLTPRTVERWIDELSKRAGLRHIHPHMFRHGKAHHMLSNGAQLIEVKEILGHTTIFSTQAYVGMSPDEFQKTAIKYI